MTRDEAIHEAGHAVVADALGFEVVTIERDEHGDMVCGIYQSDAPSAVEHLALAAYSLAGGAAHARNGGAPDCECMVDLDGAEDAVRDFLGAENPADRAAELARAMWLAQSIVNDRWEAVEAIAGYVVTFGGATGKAIAEILAMYRDGRAARRADGSVCPKEPQS